MRATMSNKKRISNAIQQWTAGKLTSATATDKEFLARFLHGPTRGDYNASPVLQQSHPELTYAYRLSDPRAEDVVRADRGGRAAVRPGSPRYI